MGSDSQKVKLSDVASINPRRKVKKGNVVPFFEMAALPLSGRSVSRSDIQERVAKAAGSHFRDGDTLMARITPCLENGKTAQVQGLGDGVIGEGSTEFIVLCGQDGADNDFIYYLCRSPDFRDFAIARMEGTSGRQRVAWKSIADYQLILPAPEIRREAASLLAKLDDRIDNLRQTNATLEAIAQALFKSWFVDFDPVRAKAEGREPEGMDAATAALFPSEFEDSELGPIPKGWWISSLGGDAEIVDCLHSKKPELLEEGFPYLQLNCIRRDGLLETSEAAWISEADYTKWTSRIEAQAGDCVITNVGRVGAVAQIPQGFKAAIGRNMTAIRRRAGFPPTFLLELLISDAMRREIELRTDAGTILSALNVKSIPQLRFTRAPNELLSRYEAVARPLREAMESNLTRATTLGTLRDTLLPRLISGKLRLPEAEREFEAATA